MTGTWDTARGSELAPRRAYRYVAEKMPPEADLDVLGEYEDAAIAAQFASDFEAYREALKRGHSRGGGRRESRRAEFSFTKSLTNLDEFTTSDENNSERMFVVRARSADERDSSTDHDCTGHRTTSRRYAGSYSTLRAA
jgi:hypothetical protein